MAADKPVLYYVAIIRRKDSYSPANSPTLELSYRFDLRSINRFLQPSYKEAIRFTAFTVAERTGAGIRQDVQENKGHCHAYGTSAGVVAVALTGGKYPGMAAQHLLSKILDEFTTNNPRTSYENLKQDPRNKEKQLVELPTLDKYIEDWQTPEVADPLANTQRELDETKDILHKTIESVLERGEKIENLVQKSDGLSASSKMFYQQAKKQNSCCVVM